MRASLTLSLIYFCLHCGFASACAHLLSSNLKRFDAQKIDFGQRAKGELKRLQITPNQFRTFVGANTVFAIPLELNDVWSVVFEPNPARYDRGFHVLGYMKNGRVTIERVRPAFAHREIEYFKRVAALHRMRPMEINLPLPLDGCQNITLQGWRQAKVWLKHRVNVTDLTAMLNQVTAAEDDRSDATDRRFVLRGQDTQRRHLRAVIEVGPLCPHGFVTAFEIN